MIDTAGEPMRVALAPWLDINLNGVERFVALLCPAIDQVLESLPVIPPHHPLRLTVCLGLPSARPGLPPDLQAELVARIGQRYNGIVSGVASFPQGHAAGLLALGTAVKQLAQNALDACVVAGVDSYIEPATLEWLEECEQYHGAGPLNNAWGFIPGEAAGALLLMRGGLIERFRLTPLARILGVGSAFEPKRVKTDTVCVGEGLTQAFRQTLAALPQGDRVTDVYCDMNGEPYRADEYGFASLRTKEAFESASGFIAPADCWGDVAAASGPLHVGIAAAAGTKHYANGRYSFVWGSSEGGERGAVLMALGGSD
jgi:3-oxoacyl-[acyl-carrier-protein] synthase-1